MIYYNQENKIWEEKNEIIDIEKKWSARKARMEKKKVYTNRMRLLQSRPDYFDLDQKINVRLYVAFSHWSGSTWLYNYFSTESSIAIESTVRGPQSP